MGLIEDELIEHLLSSSSSLKPKRYLSIWVGGGFEKWVLLSLWQLDVALGHGTCLNLVCRHTLLNPSEKNPLLSSHSMCHHTLSTPLKRSICCRHIIILGIHALVSQCHQVIHCVTICSREVDLYIFTPVSVHHHLIHHYSSLSLFILCL
jgi:hypothetical protein